MKPNQVRRLRCLQPPMSRATLSVDYSSAKAAICKGGKVEGLKVVGLCMRDWGTGQERVP